MDVFDIDSQSGWTRRNSFTSTSDCSVCLFFLSEERSIKRKQEAEMAKYGGELFWYYDLRILVVSRQESVGKKRALQLKQTRLASYIVVPQPSHTRVGSPCSTWIQNDSAIILHEKKFSTGTYFTVTGASSTYWGPVLTKLQTKHFWQLIPYISRETTTCWSMLSWITQSRTSSLFSSAPW